MVRLEKRGTSASRDSRTQRPYDARVANGSSGRGAVAVIKTIDLVGVSSESWRDAANQALREASKTIRGITGMEILDTSCNVSDGEISEYLTHVRIKFRIER
jgi:flavin-binding protein dodecin